MASRSRRSAFATPFVVVLGCGKPTPRPLPPEDVTHAQVAATAPADASPPVDARVDARPDAQIVDAHVISEAELNEHCYGPHHDWNCNPPSAIVLKIINLEVTGDAVIVTFGAGADRGLRAGMRGHLLRADGKRIDGGDFVLLRVTDRLAIAKVRMTMDQVRDLQGEIDYDEQ